MTNRRRPGLIAPFALGIGAVWGVVTLVSLVTRDYTPLVTVTPVMLIAAGFVLGARGNGRD